MPATVMTDRPASGKLTIFYDERCAFCRRCRDWLLTQPCLVPVELLPAGAERREQIVDELSAIGHELVVADDRGRVWVGGPAFLMCMWATVRYRPWAYRLARPAFAPFAERFFRFVSKRRDRWSAWMERDDPSCSWCDENNFLFREAT
jgi:predicted DCC family thiol-disulfide oxidoreductase YuxK